MAAAHADLQASLIMLLQFRRERVRKREQVTITWIRFCFKHWGGRRAVSVGPGFGRCGEGGGSLVAPAPPSPPPVCYRRER